MLETGKIFNIKRGAEAANPDAILDIHKMALQDTLNPGDGVVVLDATDDKPPRVE